MNPGARREITAGGEVRYSFRARWIANGLAAGLSLAEIKGMHFALLLQICGAIAQSKGAKLEWQNMLDGERETLRGVLDRLKAERWQEADSKLKWDLMPPLPNEVLPILEEAPES